MLVAKLLLPLHRRCPSSGSRWRRLPLWVALAFDRRTAFLVEPGASPSSASSFLRFDIMLLTVAARARDGGDAVLLRPQAPAADGRRRARCPGSPACVPSSALTIVLRGQLRRRRATSRRPGQSILLACFGGGLARGRHRARCSASRPSGSLGARLARQAARPHRSRAAAALQKMAREAPGSWEHARAMANLAEAAAARDRRRRAAHARRRLLPRPRQDGSAQVLRGEPRARRALTARGARARRLRRRHHGARRAWARRSSATAASPSRWWSSPTPTTARRWSSTSGTSARSRGTPRASPQEHFRYPGMKPQTKETAILMLVDSIEAAIADHLTRRSTRSSRR